MYRIRGCVTLVLEHQVQTLGAMVHDYFIVKVYEFRMSMLEPNNNTIFWTQIMAIPRCITRASCNQWQGAKNGLLVNANAIENQRNVRVKMEMVEAEMPKIE